MHRSSFIWTLRISFLATFFISACNIFNPSGKGDLPDSAEGMVSVGQSRLKLQDWDGAMEAFAEAIDNDSTNSMAYYGYTKAVRFKYNLNGLVLSTQLTDTAGGSLPFVGLDNETGTRYLQATARMNPVLSKLIRRDSLTRIYNSYKNPSYPIITSTQRTFMEGYLVQGNAGTPGYYPESAFPLMDGQINFEKITFDLTLTKLLYTFVNLKDLNGDTLIDSNDNIQLVEDILGLLDEGLTVDNIATNAKNLFDSAANDPAKLEQLNNVIDKIAEGTNDISEMVNLAGTLGIQGVGGSGSGTCDSTKSPPTGACDPGSALTGDIQETIASLGNQVTFYKFPDNKDNDGDGCIDEEIYDQKDNDGDGLIDEDVGGQAYGTIDSAAIIQQQLLGTFDPTNLPTTITVTVEEIYNPNDTVGGTPIELDANGQLTFTTGATFWSDSLQKADGTLNHNPRFTILNVIGKTLPPYDLGNQLNYARTNIGGCWNER